MSLAKTGMNAQQQQYLQAATEKQQYFLGSRTISKASKLAKLWSLNDGIFEWGVMQCERRGTNLLDRFGFLSLFI